MGQWVAAREDIERVLETDATNEEAIKEKERVSRLEVQQCKKEKALFRGILG